MFEIYDMVSVNSKCIDPHLIARVGLVLCVNKVKGLVHVAFDRLNRVVTVPESWLRREGVLCRRDRDADMQRYLPGRFISKCDSPSLDEIEYIAFTCHGYCELDGTRIDRTIYSATIHTKSGKLYDGCNPGHLVAMGDRPGKDYSNYGVHSKTLKEEIQMKTQSQSACNPIKKVIFNDPATIVFWNDGTKTVVQARGEAFDPEKGLAMAICRHYLCDICHLEEYRGLFQKHLKNYKKPKTGYGYDAGTIIIDTFESIKTNGKAACDLLNRMMDDNVQGITK